MRIFQKVRERIFWLNDLLHSGKLRNHLHDIKGILENYTSPASHERRESLLNKVLTHATTTTAYYSHLQNFNQLTDFPVVNKTIIRQDPTRFRARRKLGKTHKISTSGSTGTPFTVYHDENKRLRNTADTIYFAGKANFSIGNKLIFLRIWVDQFKKSPLLARLQNIRMVNVTELDDASIHRLINELQEDPSEKGILGYASALTQIGKYLDKIGSPPLKCNVTSIIAIAESLTDYCKNSMEKYFGCPVVSRYSNLENGIIAQQYPGPDSSFHINWASYVLEILEQDQDVPAVAGTSGRIVITDLFNYAMPMIRYDTGDMGIMKEVNGIPVLQSVQGRRMDMIYDTAGNAVNPMVVWKILDYKGIRQFQLIQQDKKTYTIRLSLDGEFHEQESLIRTYQEHLGRDAVIQIEITHEIPVLASGKRKLVVNNYIQGT